MTQIAKREAILAQLYTTLQTVTLPEKTISFARNEDLPLTDEVELVLMDGPQLVDYGVTGQVEYMMTCWIDGHIVDADPGSAVNALYAAVVTTLLDDITVNGLANDIFESDLEIDRERGDGNRKAMQFTLEVTVKYHGTHANPYTNI